MGKARERKVQPVEINEDLAMFALSALKNPLPKECKEVENEIKEETDESKPSISQKSQVTEHKDAVLEDKTNTKPQVLKLVKPDRNNILDIIAAKLKMAD